MRILIACEFSGTVRDAFLQKGHDTISCDLLPSDKPGPHYQGDVLDILDNNFDMLIAFPPCTYLAASGMHWTTRGLRDPQLTIDALAFVRRLLTAKIKYKCLENPIGAINTRIRKPNQIIQPWQFGHDASKKTCLWLENLPELRHTTIVPPKGYQQIRFADDCIPCPDCGEPYCTIHNEHYADCECIGPTEDDVIYKRIDGYLFGAKKEIKPIWGNQTPSGQNKLGPTEDRWKLRSKTYQGIADAMADQWGNI